MCASCWLWGLWIGHGDILTYIDLVFPDCYYPLVGQLGDQLKPGVPAISHVEEASMEIGSGLHGVWIARAAEDERCHIRACPVGPYFPDRASKRGAGFLPGGTSLP